MAEKERKRFHDIFMQNLSHSFASLQCLVFFFLNIVLFAQESTGKNKHLIHHLPYKPVFSSFIPPHKPSMHSSFLLNPVSVLFSQASAFTICLDLQAVPDKATAPEEQNTEK